MLFGLRTRAGAAGGIAVKLLRHAPAMRAPTRPDLPREWSHLSQTRGYVRRHPVSKHARELLAHGEQRRLRRLAQHPMGGKSNRCRAADR
jgi:hypothetical protein